VSDGSLIERGVDEAHVRDVLAIEDRVLRNYWVTQSYADLSTALATRLDPVAANWCTFATWASKTVGENLRGEGLPEWLRDRVTLDDGMMGAIHATGGPHRGARLAGLVHDLTPDHVVEVIADRFGATAKALSDGNSLVYEEVAPAAASFLHETAPGSDTTPAERRARVLDVCADAPVFEGVNRLAAGFSAWCDAIEAPDPRARNQMILTGSLQIGVHEQSRLQHAIESGVDLGVDDLIGSLARRMLSGAGWLRPVVWGIEVTVRPVAECIGHVWDDVMTDLVGAADTPDGRLKLGVDIPALPGEPFVPVDLAAPVRPELGHLLDRFDRSDGTGRGSRAADWVVLDDRMNWILNLFRSRQHDPRLHDAPFPDAIVREIQAGTIPGERVR
jgi:hypothetical protein